MSSADGPSAATSDFKKASEAKPIKLRSACNCCFAAKVRCDGNKDGCKRCAEKRLDCTYSESMVGRVVGKRRKRPLPDARPSDCKMNPWNVATGPTAMPSPASTHVSDQPHKRNCVSNDWTNLITYDEQSPLDFPACEKQFVTTDLRPDGITAPMNETSFVVNAGLPTPSMSPPEMQFLSPSDLEACSHSRSSSTKLLNQGMPVQFGTQSQPVRQHLYQVEDDETVCIKLLAHLKRFSSQQQQSLQATQSLVSKTNAAIKQLLRSRTIRTEYMCHLLLTNIVMHLAAICEQMLTMQCSQTNSYSDQDFINECYLAENEQESSPDLGGHEPSPPEPNSSAKDAVHESALLCSNIGDLLKRKPLNGFQILGRHESALIEVEVRLKRVIASFS